MKLRPYSYSLTPGPATKIGENGRVMFVTGESIIAEPICFAVYYDSDLHVWHLSPIAYKETEYAVGYEICLELFACREADIQGLLKKDNHEDPNS